MNAFRIPGLVIVVGLVVAGLVFDQTRDPPVPQITEIVSPVPVVAGDAARSSTWFCTAATGDSAGLAASVVTLSNTTLEPKSAVVSVFRGGPQPEIAGQVDELVELLAPQSSVNLRLAELAPDSALVSIAVEIEGGGVLVERVASGPTGVDRASCETEGSSDWVVTSGATGPGARLQLAVFNPFPDDAVVDIDFVTEAGARSPEDLVALHVPSRSARLVEVGDVVAASDTVSSFVRARSGRVVVEGIQTFDGAADPLGLSLLAGVPAPAETWTFAGVSPRIGPARLVVINPGDALIRADVEVYPAGAERFVEPFELTLRPGQSTVVSLAPEGRLAGIDTFTLVVRSFDGPRVVAGMEQRPVVPEEGAIIDPNAVAPATGFAASAGQAVASDSLFTTIDLAEDDDRSALHVFNPAVDTFVTIEATIYAQGASRTERLEVGPERTGRVPLADLATGEFTVRLDASGPIYGAREITGLSSRSWAPMLPLDR